MKDLFSLLEKWGLGLKIEPSKKMGTFSIEVYRLNDPDENHIHATSREVDLMKIVESFFEKDARQIEG